MSEIRQFESGATRDTDMGKPDYRGFLSALAIRRFGEYMHKNRLQADGSIRDSDNWKHGIPQLEYVSSGCRHWEDVLEWFESGRFDYPTSVDIEESLCAMLFNVQGLLHEIVKERVQYEQALGRAQQRNKQSFDYPTCDCPACVKGDINNA